jgi:xylulokinase
MSILAIDIGSSRCKAVAFSPSGEILAQSERSYAAEFPSPLHAELDPQLFWSAFCYLCRDVSSRLPENPVEALCLSSHGETFIPVDLSGQALGPAILNIDGRAFAESEWCAKTIGRAHLFEITGLVAHPMYPLPKLLWLREHRPEIFLPARFVAVTTYLLLRLKLPPYVDYSLASRFLAFDVTRACWSAEILSALGLKVEQLPIPVPAGTTAGKLDSSTATALGLPSGVVVVLGGHDQASAALGMGAVESGIVSDSIGTYECVTVTSREPFLGQAAFSAHLNSYCHVVPELYLNLAYFPSGIMVQWFRKLLLGTEVPSNTSADDSLENASFPWLESHVPKSPTGLCVTPHLIGTCFPDFNPHARATIWGLDPTSDRAQIYKGILEGIASELAEVTDRIAGIAGAFSEIYCTGGGTRSLLGMNLRASLTGKNFHLFQCSEAVCLGGAILGAVAIGWHGSLREAAHSMVRKREVIEPCIDEGVRYREQRASYQSLCQFVRSSALHLSNSPGEPRK